MSKLYTMNEITKMTTLSRRQIEDMVERGEFPKPKRISERRVAWLDSDYQEWVECLEAKP